MKKIRKHRLKTWFLVAALTASFCANSVLAAQPETSTETVAPEQPEEPAVPESYEWEIQSNSIPGWPQGPKVVAETAILMDLDSGAILYAKGIDEKRAPASTTKIMTALLAIEQVPFDTQITFTEEVNNIEPDSTHIGIKPGETLTMKDCAYAILLASANEVSSGVAEYIGGTVSAFVDSMNERAAQLGCENTHFVNANGLYHEDHYTTARDLALISREAFQNETFREIIKTPYYIVPTTNITAETRWLNNHHKMVLPDKPEYYQGCLGGKTGYTEKAGNTLVTYAERNDLRLVCVVLADNISHYNDTKNLFDYGFEQFQKITPSSQTITSAKGDILGKELLSQGLLESDFSSSSLIVPKEGSEALSFSTDLNDANELNLTYYYGDTAIGHYETAASKDVLALAKELGFKKDDQKQGSITFSDKKEENIEKETPKTVVEIFQSLPNWKYPALLFLLAAVIFYIITLWVKIRRSIKRRKKKKAKKG